MADDLQVISYTEDYTEEGETKQVAHFTPIKFRYKPPTMRAATKFQRAMELSKKLDDNAAADMVEDASYKLLSEHVKEVDAIRSDKTRIDPKNVEHWKDMHPLIVFEFTQAVMGIEDEDDEESDGPLGN